MSRANPNSTRTLTLPEELEKLEQSITLTLQEIDRNFSRAHRIVTTSILPVVEQYAKHSEAVWEGSKFWKQFFEASANVSLSGYEDPHNEDHTGLEEDAALSEGDPSYATSQPTRLDDDTENDTIQASMRRAESEGADTDEDDSTLLLSSPSIGNAQSTPRPRHRAAGKENTTMRDVPSPFRKSAAKQKTSDLPSTPGRDVDITASSSPFPMSALQSRVLFSARKGTAHQDPLLHRMLDKTYRIAATPHTARREPKPSAVVTPGLTTKTTLPHWLNDSPDSSPAIAAPQLRAEIFGSPFKSNAQRTPKPTVRTPGVSVMTPGTTRRLSGRDEGTSMRMDPAERTATSRFTGTAKAWDSDSDEDEDGLGISPPKTMQFHVPQSRLLQTPAREASKRIVEDLLFTAGGDITDEIEDDSPSVVRRNHELDDSF
ncbi:hypothetical protein P152DRAFT_459555 [Eremomyces bilateralis CBS 781.70]|uniref:DASH complex subunit ASK1 n=1 Tax=Eremomyces bilateralis CBS 781.70 TaxID=1392243 RepID=A0A6G1G112_9PEZI|nr:uncharacterized protein P152DRAFT_459555 [Eremomyces bilateralis CBS 781.70]KAF1811616.1 hypothetical protein P152DRAFT_459555 [Eremomyces bilateralis CBS 781.70]